MLNIYEIAKKQIGELLRNEVEKIIANIHDIYTEPTEKRKITMILEFSPTSDRKEAGLSVKINSKLAKAFDVDTRFRIKTDKFSEGYVLEEIPEG